MNGGEVEAMKQMGYRTMIAMFLIVQALSTLLMVVFVLRHAVLVHVAQMIVPAALAVLAALRYRLASPIAAVYGSLLAVTLVIRLYHNFTSSELLLYNPAAEASDSFTGANIGQLLLALAIVIISLADIRSGKGQMNRMPGAWSYTIGGFAIGAMSLGVVVALLTQANWVAGITAQSVSVLPVFEMRADGVRPASLESRAGEALAIRVVNHSGNSCHILAFPELGARVHVEEGRSGLLLIRPKEPGTYTYQCELHHSYINERIQGTLTVSR